MEAEMIMDHVILTVSDVGAAGAFLEAYFGVIGDGSRNRAFLLDDRWLVLSMFRSRDVVFPATFHIGFGRESEAKVDELNARLRADGFDVDPPAHSHAYTFHVRAAGGFTVEVMH